MRAVTLWTALMLGAVAPASGAADGALRVIEGDILVPAEELSRRGVVFARHRLWPDGVVPVWLDPAIGETALREVRAAMATWSRVAGVRLDELDGLPASSFDHVRVEPGEGCASWVGRRGGAQSLWVAPDCSGGAVLHELGHALGLEHEHTRPDRDAWIRIHWDNIDPQKRHNFDLAPPDTRLLGEYDYGSIMHYGAEFFGIDSRVTIEPLDPQARIGQRTAPSAGDIAAIAELYGTDLALSADVFDDGDTGALLLQAQVTNRGASGAHAVRLAARLPDGWQLATGQDKRVDALTAWQCSTAALLTCTLARLDAGAVAMLSLELSVPPTAQPDTQSVALRVEAGNDDLRPDNDTATLRRVRRADGGSVFVDAFATTDDQASRPLALFDGTGSVAAASPDAIGVGAGGTTWWMLLLPVALGRRFRAAALRR